MNEKKHIPYSTADIERYRKGLMTAKEMNALEKAALDDPFLADAIEGFTLVSVPAEDDLSSLNKRIDAKIQEQKVVPINQSRYTWLRIAAAFLLIAGMAGLAYYSIFPNNEKDVVAIEKNEVKTITTEAAKPGITDTTIKTTETDQKKEPSVTIETNKKTAPAPAAKEEESSKAVHEASPTVAAAPEKKDDFNNDKKEAADQLNNAPERKKYSTEEARQNSLSNTADNVTKVKREAGKSNERVLNETAVSRGIAAENNKTNYFRGQVLDANNSPLPFVNVTIIKDHIGTYTDVKGNFVLISPDSVLEVKVYSVGYENRTVQLFDDISSNPIVMQQDSKPIPSTVLNTKKTNAGREIQDHTKIEEPEPADGWGNYDIYIANNIKISDEIKEQATPSRKVELLFDVNKNGEPVNIKVEKSACEECDKEAIRLLKEGPKWKKKKNKKARLSVGFSLKK